MNKSRIVHILAGAEDGQPIKVNGWVRTRRVSKKIAFIVISDGSCQSTLQAIIEESSSAFASVEQLTTGSSVRLEGFLRASPAKGQDWELVVDHLHIWGLADPSFPLQKKGHSLEFLREIGHLRPRTNTFGALYRVHNALSAAVHEFFQQRDYIWAQTPVLTANDCEGAGEMFTATTLPFENFTKDKDGTVSHTNDFFGKKAHLTVSGQLEAEFLALSHGNVYTFGPTFRAENSHTTRHLAEFWMVEPEVAFANLHDLMDLAQDFLQYVIGRTLERCRPELLFFEKMYKQMTVQRLESIQKDSFVRLTYTEAVERLQRADIKFEFPVEWGTDLQTEHERYLTDVVFGKPVLVYDYPAAFKAFYMRANDDGKTVAAMDLLVPGVGELMGGSQREERLDKLESRMDLLDIPKESLDWYLDLRRFGTAPHSGFGLGFERLVMYVTGMQNIRDAILCPRTPKNIDF